MNVPQLLSDLAEYFQDNLVIEDFDPIATLIYEEIDLDKQKNKVLLGVRMDSEIEYAELSNQSLLATFTIDVDFIFQRMTEADLVSYQNAYFEAVLDLLVSRSAADFEYIVPIKSTFFDAVEGRENAKALEFIFKASKEVV